MTDAAAGSESGEASRPTILVPVLDRAHIRAATPLIRALVLAEDAELVLLEIARPSFDATGEARTPEPADSNTEYAEELAEAVPTRIEQRTGHNVAGVLREAVEELEPDLLLLTWRQRRSRRLLPDERVLLDVLMNLPCDAVILGGALPEPEQDESTPSILVTGATPESLAGRIALDLSDGGRTLTALVPAGEADSSPERDAWREAETPASIEVGRELGAEAVLSATAEGEHDLLIVPAPRNGILHRLAIGTDAERIARRSAVPVLIVKERRGRAASVLQRGFDHLAQWLPPLDEARKVDVYRDVRRSSRASADFFVLVGLAAVIASIGLLLDSGAVVIGGMLVAPLMSPVVGMGLAVVQGDARFLRLSALSTVRGAALAVLLGLLAVIVTPGGYETAEVLSRGGPSLLDLIVAIAAGAAAAYALSRESLSPSLPGVAIAVAIVPPLSVVGIGLGTHDLALASGSALLFGTNVVAIAASSGLVFLWLGFRPEPDDRSRIQVSGRGFLALALLLAVMVVPLSLLTAETVREDRFQRDLQSGIDRAFAELPGVEASRYTVDARDGETLELTIEVKALGSLDAGAVATIESALVSHLHRAVDVRLLVLQVTELSGEPAEEGAAEGPVR